MEIAAVKLVQQEEKANIDGKGLENNTGVQIEEPHEVGPMNAESLEADQGEQQSDGAFDEEVDVDVVDIA